MSIVYLSLGSNIGDRRLYIEKAVAELKVQDVQVLKVSKIIETDPLDAPAQEKFLNAVLKVRTNYSPEELLNVTKAIERRLGRVKKVFRGPRTIDIDILLYEDIKLATPQLVLPHPRMWERPFVMEPLKEIAPDILN